MRPPLIIIGSHRSGTSATAQALGTMGLFLGARLQKEHAEPFWLADLHDEYLYEVGATWYAPQRLLDYLATEHGKKHCAAFLRLRVQGRGGYYGLWRNFGGFPHGALMALGWPLAWGWKEPRTTLFASIWAEIFPEARFLHVVRHPLDVAISLQRRELKALEAGDPPKPGLEDLDTCVALVGQYVQCGLEMAKLGDRYREIRFEDLQENPAEGLADLARFAGMSISKAKLERAVSQIDSKRRSRWQQLPDTTVAELMQAYPFAARFGYRTAVL
ncbi:MAG TPA: sulfotransferase [Chthonomonadaceae bacterium]|nr:sulfotransferase [Chthonomonadaceae bacterium]